MKTTKKRKKTLAVRQGNYRRWREQRGIKLVMSIVPFGYQKRAVCEFEGITYKALGSTHTEALEKLIEILSGRAI